MNIEKTGLLTIMAVLVIGLASSPMLQNFGTAYAQTDRETESETDVKRVQDRKCWETDNGELRCEGHDGRCFKNADGTIHCEKQDRRCWETDEGDLRCEENDEKRDIKMALDRFCELSEREQKEIMEQHPFFREHHARIAEYCQMSDDRREEFKRTHQDFMMDFKERHAEMLDEKKMQMKDSVSDQKLRIFKNLDITDEKKEMLIQKYRSMHTDMTDEQRNEIRKKMMDQFSDHFKMKYKDRYDAMTDAEREDLKARHDVMVSYKAELREKYQDMTDEQRDQFRQNFIDQAHDKKLLWLSPVKQTIAGINADEIECREGLSLVVKASNGMPMCLKSSTATKLIERGIVIPGN